MKTFLRLYIDSYQGLSRPAWLLALVMLVNRTGAMVLPFLGLYMTQALDFSIREVGIVLACFGLGAITGSWLGGWLTDSFGNFWVQAFRDRKSTRLHSSHKCESRMASSA